MEYTESRGKEKNQILFIGFHPRHPRLDLSDHPLRDWDCGLSFAVICGSALRSEPRNTRNARKKKGKENTQKDPTTNHTKHTKKTPKKKQIRSSSSASICVIRG